MKDGAQMGSDLALAARVLGVRPTWEDVARVAYDAGGGPTFWKDLEPEVRRCWVSWARAYLGGNPDAFGWTAERGRAVDAFIAEHGKPADDGPRGDGGDAARACADMSPALCGEVFVDPDTGAEDAANPCVLPAGHDDERHQDAKLHHWYPIVSRKPTTLAAAPAPALTDAAEASEWHSRYEQAARLAEDRLAYIDRIRAALGVGALADPVEAVTAARLALNCGLTADERREPAYLVTCRSRGAPCAACELARCHGTVAHFRARLKRREAELDAEIDKAAAIRGALGCRDGERTIDVARDVAPRLLNAEIALNDALRERDAYHATARANGEQRDRFAAIVARMIAIWDGAEVNGVFYPDRIRDLVAAVRDGGAPVDPRDAQHAYDLGIIARERDAYRSQALGWEEAAKTQLRRAMIADAEIIRLREALDAGAARASGLVDQAEARAEQEIARLTRERDALAAAARKADEAQGDWRTWGPAWDALLALLPAMVPARRRLRACPVCIDDNRRACGVCSALPGTVAK